MSCFKFMKNEKGSIFLEMIPAFIVFFAVVSFSINFFIYAYSGTVLSMGAQEAARETVASFSTSAGQTQGLRYIKNYGVGNLIKNPTITVTVNNAVGDNSTVTAAASGNVKYTYFGNKFFAQNGLTTKIAICYLEYTMQTK